MSVQTGLSEKVSRIAREAARAPRRRWVWLGALIAIETVAIAWLGWYVHRERVVWSQRTAYLRASLGKDKEDAGDLTGAVDEYRAAVKLYPDNSKAWYVLGRALRKGKPQLGLKELRHAAELAPSDPAILRDYGEALVDNANLDEARAVLTRAVALKPDDEPAHVALGRAYLGRVTSPQDLDRGLAELQEALRLQPGEVQAHFRLARALFQASRLPEAQGEFERTLALLGQGARQQQQQPMDGSDHYSLMWLNLAKGCHHYLSEIAYRSGPRAEAEAHRRQFDAMEAYLSDTYALFKQRSQAPNDPAPQRRLAVIFRRNGFPPGGPDGPAAASRWVTTSSSTAAGGAAPR
jgi:cytochrome c-type biogenesis protein CcmH/NrfG